MTNRRPRPFLLMVLDGWGLGEPGPANAIYLARTPNMDRFMAEYATAALRCSGEAVGLPEGQMGNSEVGHLNLGAGRIVYQDFTRINLAIRDGSFFENAVLNEAFNRAQASNGTVHLMGLVSDGGVHSHIEHIYALLELARRRNFRNVAVHAFLDGRDTPPKSAANYLKALQKKIDDLETGCIASVMGRYYAMDRDRRWDRTKQAYDALVYGEGRKSSDAVTAVMQAYELGETDEFVKPTVIEPYRHHRVKTGDSIIFFNFRPDRARQLTRAFTEKGFSEFDRGSNPPDVYFVCFTEYDRTFALPVAFPPEKLKNLLTDVLADNGLRQLRIAETEKYAHVTFFFNGGEEEPRPMEDRILIPSPRVPTYDMKPEMSAYEVTDTLIEKIYANIYDFILINYANPDMVGHTGSMEAAIKAVEAVDECVGRVIKALLEQGGEAIITADHGNADRMIEEGSKPHTAHTTSKVPFIYVSPYRYPELRSEGILADVAPTILHALELPKPPEMTGKSMVLSYNVLERRN